MRKAGAHEVRGALKALLRALGELPAGTLDQASMIAYKRAVELLEPDEFGERFKAKAAAPLVHELGWEPKGKP